MTYITANGNAQVTALLTLWGGRSLYRTQTQAGVWLVSPGPELEGPASIPAREAPHLPLSGCRLSHKHRSCSSPRWILSSSSRCSMVRADFIFTKCS